MLGFKTEHDATAWISEDTRLNAPSEGVERQSQ